MARSYAGGSISALIAAAGANERLSGLVSTGGKPLILVNGKPLIRHALDHARDFWEAAEVVIVASPDNVKSLTQVVIADSWVVQPEPTGVVNAIARGIRFIESVWTVILCADNTFDTQGIILPEVINSLYFGARQLDKTSAKRFTRYTQANNFTRFIEASSDETGEGCWIGPLVLPTEAIKKYVGISETIVQLVNVIQKEHRTLTPLNMHCTDMGVPEEAQSIRLR